MIAKRINKFLEAAIRHYEHNDIVSDWLYDIYIRLDKVPFTVTWAELRILDVIRPGTRWISDSKAETVILQIMEHIGKTPDDLYGDWEFFNLPNA